MSLHPDDGTRSAFAVVRVLGSPVKASVEKCDGTALLSVPHWLPGAEHRFLAVTSSLWSRERRSSYWTLSADRLANVLDVLHERLGLVVGEEEES